MQEMTVLEFAMFCLAANEIAREEKAAKKAREKRG